MAIKVPIPLLNEQQATFECIYGRGCDGICCQNGRPGLTPAEASAIEEHMAKFAPHLRPTARRLIEKKGFLTRRIRHGKPLVAVDDGWCVFFNQGCVLHKVGAAEGDKYRYKPLQCAIFPLVDDDDGNWYVRQVGYQNEPWDLFCLRPGETNKLAVASLQEELTLVAKLRERRPIPKRGAARRTKE